MERKIVTDPSLIQLGVEILIDADNYTIHLMPKGQLKDALITKRCLYHWVKKFWLNQSGARKNTFPFKASGEFLPDIILEILEPWKFADEQTVKLIRGDVQ